MGAQKIAETELFYPVKKWLEEREYEVFSEVSPSFSSSRADIVARRSPAITVIELKTSLTLELLDQAFGWKGSANYIYVAIPRRKKPIPRLVRDFCKKHRIGLLEIDTRGYSKGVYEAIPARYNKPYFNNLNWDEELLPEHKTALPGGSSGGGYVTPYKLTITKVKSYLFNRRRWRRLEWDPEGWVTIAEILEHCETHYATPKNSLSKALREFEYSWCETKKEKGKLYFRHTEEAKL